MIQLKILIAEHKYLVRLRGLVHFRSWIMASVPEVINLRNRTLTCRGSTHTLFQRAPPEEITIYFVLVTYVWHDLSYLLFSLYLWRDHTTFTVIPSSFNAIVEAPVRPLAHPHGPSYLPQVQTSR
jgi:hypothetical protein